jgi:hypothetical protein
VITADGLIDDFEGRPLTLRELQIIKETTGLRASELEDAFLSEPPDEDLVWAFARIWAERQMREADGGT